MSSTNLIRWSGLISILAGVLYALAAILHPVGEDIAAYTSPNWVPAHLIYWVSAILMLFSLIGLYARQVEKAGWLGLVGFVLAFIGTAFVGSIFVMASTVIHLVAVENPALFERVGTPSTATVLVVVLGFSLGYILFGVASMRAGVLPRWSGLLLIIGVSFFMISEAPLFDRSLSHVIVTVGDVVFGLGLAWMGYALWSEQREPVLMAKGVSYR
jgi:hypothetical protein